MSTRSDIIVERADGKFARIYCHSDGYLSHNGMILWGNYDTQAKCEKLVGLGDLSTLGREIGKKVDFDQSQKDYQLLHAGKITEEEHNRRSEATYVQCRAYGRDRGETGTEARVCDSLSEAFEELAGEYHYVWRRIPWPDGSSGQDGLWQVTKDDASQTLVSLEKALTGEAIIDESDRWCMPWISMWREDRQYDVHCCIDGRAYVIRLSDGAAYCFDSHLELAQWLDARKTARNEPNIWNAMGSFDPARHGRLRATQDAKLATLFPVPPEHDRQPPRIAPNYLADGDEPRRPYSFEELLKEVNDRRVHARVRRAMGGEQPNRKGT